MYTKSVIRVKDFQSAEQPNPTAGSPGIARICLTDNDIHLRAKDEIVIPATTVFEDGPNIGKPEDSSTWRYEVKEGFKFPAQFLTLTAVSLRKSKPCAEAKVQMLTGAGGTETMKRASDNHIFVIDDVLDYPIPTERPPIEIGKLIDDISVEAMLTTDVTQAVNTPLSDAGAAGEADFEAQSRIRSDASGNEKRRGRARPGKGFPSWESCRQLYRRNCDQKRKV